MVASNVYIDKITGEEWLIEKALLEVAGGYRNIVLLVSNQPSHDGLQRAEIMYKVVFAGKMVSGDWYLEPSRLAGAPDSLMIKFHFNGDDGQARWHRYVPLLGTDGWVRTTDNRVLLEIKDILTAQRAYGLEQQRRRIGLSDAVPPDAE